MLPTVACLVTYAPYAAFGGLLFAGPAVVVAVFLVAFVVYGLRISLRPISVLVLMACMWVLGFALGLSPGMHGQGP